MKIFALETNLAKLNQSFLSHSEQIIVVVQFHGLRFFFRCITGAVVTALLVAVLLMGTSAGIPASMLLVIVLVGWAILVLRPLLRGFIDWKYDELLVTTEKIVIVNQSSIIRQEVKQMNLENLASVNTRTQFWNIFPFGELFFELKEGTGQSIRLRYIPLAQRVCALISDTLVKYKRRQNEIPAP